MALSEGEQHTQVNEEWSAVKTLRHLVFVSDGSFREPVLGVPKAFHPVGLAPSFVPDQAAMGLDPYARPSFAEVAEVPVKQQREVTDSLQG